MAGQWAGLSTCLYPIRQHRSIANLVAKRLQLLSCSIFVVGDEPQRNLIGLRYDTMLLPQVFSLHVHKTRPVTPIRKELFSEVFDHFSLRDFPKHDGCSLQACQ